MRTGQARDAGLRARLAAIVLDAMLLAALLAFVSLVVCKLGLVGAGGDAARGLRAMWSHASVQGATAAGVAAATVAAWRALGATPGSLLVGVIVVRARDGRRPGIGRSALRLGAALATGGIGLLWSFGGRRALHDRLSGTRAVIEDAGLEDLDELEGATR